MAIVDFEAAFMGICVKVRLNRCVKVEWKIQYNESAIAESTGGVTVLTSDIGTASWLSI